MKNIYKKLDPWNVLRSKNHSDNILPYHMWNRIYCSMWEIAEGRVKGYSRFEKVL